MKISWETEISKTKIQIRILSWKNLWYPEGSISLRDLILSPAEIQMENWNPNVLNIMQ